MAEQTQQAQQLRVFVSHSSEDNDFARAIVAALRGAGADVWFDDENLGSGQLLGEIQRELGVRPVFIVILSKAAFASEWVKREVTWAYQMTEFDPTRTMLPVTAAPIAREDFSPASGWFFLYGYKRIEAAGFQPYEVPEAANRLLRARSLTPAGEAPAPVAPQPAESVDDLVTRGKAFTAQKKYAEALPLFERAAQLDPNSFDAWANRGDTLWRLKRFTEALDACNRAIALDDKQAWIWSRSGAALDDLGRHQEALAAYDRALALDPNYRDAWYNKGTAFRGLKRYSDAVSAYDKAIALDPNYADAWYNKAISLRALGRTADAEVAERRVKELG